MIFTEFGLLLFTIAKYLQILYNFTSTTKNSPEREKRPYICGLRTRIECEPLRKHSTHNDRVTDIGYLLSFGAFVLLRNSESK